MKYKGRLQFIVKVGALPTQALKVLLGGDMMGDGDQWLGRKGKGKYQKRSDSGSF